MEQLIPSKIHVNDVDLAFIEQGTGDAVVFVHGSVNDYRSWRMQIEPFAQRYRVVSYSRRHHWPNARPVEGDRFSIGQHAADLAGLIEALDLAPAHVIGSSFGAMTALTMAVAHPELTRSLVLGEPPLLPWLASSSEGKALQETFLEQAFRPAGEALNRGENEAGIRTFIDGVIGPGAFDRMPEGARSMMLDNAAVERLEIATPPEDYFPDLTPEKVANLQVPLLLVEGARSPRMFGLITDELARALPHAERALILDASHGMHGQNPAAYNETVLAFLAKH